MTSADWLNSPDPAQREVEQERLNDIGHLRGLMASNLMDALDSVTGAQSALNALVGDAVADSAIALTHAGPDLDHFLTTAARSLRAVGSILRQMPPPGQDDD